MDFSINGSYLPYLWVILLSEALFFLQRLDHVRRRSAVRGASQTANVLIDFYCALTAFVASVLGWGRYLLAVYVAYKFGIPAGVLFFVAFFFGGMLLTFLVPPGVVFDVTSHVVSLIATPFLLDVLLRSLSIIA